MFFYLEKYNKLSGKNDILSGKCQGNFEPTQMWQPCINFCVKNREKIQNSVIKRGLSRLECESDGGSDFCGWMVPCFGICIDSQWNLFRQHKSGRLFRVDDIVLN